MNPTQYTDKIWTIEDFLSAVHCEDLIAFSEQRGYEEATVSLPEGAKMIKGLRNNYRVILKDYKFAQSLYDRLRPVLQTIDATLMPAGLNEAFRFYRYDKNQRFKRHIDGRVKAEGLESRLTFMVYLNADYDGGETKFNDALIQPKTGMALLFVHEQKHESLSILRGQKYVLRSDVFYSAPSSDEAL